MNWIGYIAAILTTISFIPQVIHTIKVKDTRSISLGMYALFVLGTICWLVYGIMLSSLPMILANIPTIFFSTIVLFIKIRNILSGRDAENKGDAC
jgi:MtN3 and saliva related transmembrane protein